MHKIFGLIPDNIDIISSFTHVSPNLRLQLFSGKPNKIFGEKCKKKHGLKTVYMVIICLETRAIICLIKISQTIL